MRVTLLAGFETLSRHCFVEVIALRAFALYSGPAKLKLGHGFLNNFRIIWCLCPMYRLYSGRT